MRKHGFTLIELMIVITVAAILAAVGFPAYHQYIVKARRADATSTLLQGAQYMERFYTENGRYDQDTGGTSISLPAKYSKSPQEGTTTHYNLSLSSVASTNFTLTAVPVGDQASSDTNCGTLTVNSAGVKCISGGSSCSNNPNQSVQQSVSDCW